MTASTKFQFRTLLAALFVSAALPGGALAEVRVREAYAGEPFGVGRVEVELPEDLLPQPLGLAGLLLADKDGRVLYPALENRLDMGMVTDVLSQSRRPALRILGEVLERPARTSVFFLFRGREPLELAVQSRRVDVVRVPPVADPAGHRRLVAAWWRSYSAPPSLLQSADYPPLVENYLRSMLAHRLGLSPPRQSKPRYWEQQFAEELWLAGETESLRIAYQRERFLGPPPPAEAAERPLPEPIEVPEPEGPPPPAGVPVEPLAMRVPAECLYVRFGSFGNFLWFQDTLARWGGDFQNLVAARGLDRGLRDRFQSRLVLQTTLLSRLFGEQVVSDVAIVGTDLFFAQGGAYGVLFQAKSPRMLASDVGGQRRERLKKKDGAAEQTVKIDGHEVSFLSSPDGSVRSFYLSDGDYHFVTTSRWLARRFLATRSGKESLGATPEFRRARQRMPLARNDAVFVYLSSRFFRNFVSPAYRVEMGRQLKAQADIELVEMALLASAAEQKPGESIEQLASGGFLPPGFGPRGDGSQTLIAGGEARDSLRGEPGFFVPIPDVEVTGVTPSEAAAYRRFAQFYASRWERLNPVLVGIQRKSLPGDREQVTLDARIAPLARTQYEFLSRMIGPADQRRLDPIPGDAAALELILPRQRIFAGLQGVGPAMEVVRGEAVPLGRLRNLLVGYAGTTGELGPLGSLGRRVATPPDPAGYSQGEAGLWSRRLDQFTVFSFQRDLLEAVTSRLKLVPAERPAQVRLRAADLSPTKTASFANTWGYQRSRQTSLGNLRLVHQAIQQFHVPGDRAKTAAELILDAKLICPLGGQYVYRQTPQGAGCWTSTFFEGERTDGPLEARLPSGYQAPPLNWFRGLDLEALVEPEALSFHAQIIMQMPEKRAEAKEKAGTKDKQDR